MAEKRNLGRHRKRFSLRFGSGEPTTMGFTEDISTTGLFIKSAKICTVGSVISVELALDEERNEPEAAAALARPGQRRALEARVGDGVVEEQPPGAQQGVDVPEVLVQPGPADVLHHAHAGDLVERRAVPEGPVVVLPDRRVGAPAQPLDPRARRRELVGAHGDAEGPRAVADRGVLDQRAPPAADVEEAVPGGEPELPADQVELLPLRLAEPLAALGEVGAGVDHRLVEEEPVEVVGDVVVVPDRERRTLERAIEYMADLLALSLDTEERGVHCAAIEVKAVRSTDTVAAFREAKEQLRAMARRPKLRGLV